MRRVNKFKKFCSNFVNLFFSFISADARDNLAVLANISEITFILIFPSQEWISDAQFTQVQVLLANMGGLC
jgi:hypothetical protein